MLKPKLASGGVMLLQYICTFVLFSLVSARVENSFQSSSQYSQFKDASTPSTYHLADLTLKGSSSVGGDVSNSPGLGESFHYSQDSMLSQGTAQQPIIHGAAAAAAATTGNQHVYHYETYPTQAQDTSRQNAYGVPGTRQCTYMRNGNMRCYPRQDSGYDYDTTGEDGGSSGGGLGGLAGLVGLLGLKGLKGLASVLFPAIFPILFPLILPLALPLLLPLLLLLLVPILLLPIPIISLPAPTGRSLAAGFSEARKMAEGAFERIVSSDECIERVSCEIAKMSQKRKAGEWMEKALRFLPESSPVTKKIFKGFSMGSEISSKTSADEQTCSKMKCKMLSVFDTPSG